MRRRMMATGTGKVQRTDLAAEGGDEWYLLSEGCSYCRLSGWARKGNLE